MFLSEIFRTFFNDNKQKSCFPVDTVWNTSKYRYLLSTFFLENHSVFLYKQFSSFRLTWDCWEKIENRPQKLKLVWAIEWRNPMQNSTDSKKCAINNRLLSMFCRCFRSLAPRSSVFSGPKWVWQTFRCSFLCVIRAFRSGSHENGVSIWQILLYTVADIKSQIVRTFRAKIYFPLRRTFTTLILVLFGRPFSRTLIQDKLGFRKMIT